MLTTTYCNSTSVEDKNAVTRKDTSERATRLDDDSVSSGGHKAGDRISFPFTSHS
ncbi:hypothetical protein CY34DRAFT_800827 [Suillus luteus UH-Slu-Lm8-n1]|uniref:Uncharacterized protein n=1 Tax=Suillus luteus UH-Slu-Lm8-n1 TaxID=930992 RepID=A0A0D0BJL6_9AGAM|nr:hypothetical protein CY34DRAFT_800827 [Suillus luteus UH-Slu-Lm8-n1]